MSLDPSQLTDKQKRKLGKLSLFRDDSKLALFDELQEINESLEKIAQKDLPDMPHFEMPEVQKIKIEGVELVTIKGDRGSRFLGYFKDESNLPNRNDLMV